MKRVIKDSDKLWGETGPYSQAHFIVETRILDDRVSRVFVLVEVHINPYTFELIKKNRTLFKDDVIIQQLIDHSDYRGQEFGYVSCAFEQEFNDDDVLQRANEQLKLCESTIIKMHKFVMNHLKESYWN